MTLEACTVRNERYLERNTKGVSNFRETMRFIETSQKGAEAEEVTAWREKTENLKIG